MLQPLWKGICLSKGSWSTVLEATLGPISFDVEDQIGIFWGEDCVGFEKKMGKWTYTAHMVTEENNVEMSR